MGWKDYFQKENEPEKPSFPSGYIAIPQEVHDKWDELNVFTSTQQIAVGLVAVSSFAVGVRVGRMVNPFQRYSTVKDIPNALIGETAPFMRGRCVSVSDGDTIRIKHAPTMLHSSRRADGEKLSDTTLPIRICTIDTPETAKFGNAGQAFGEEAKTHLSSLLDGRIVKVKLLTTDQYGRAVAEVKTGLWPTYADETMLKAGLAEVYTGSGAVYGHKGKDTYMAMQEKAKSSSKGMWSDSSRESASEYKARIKAEKG